MSKLLTTDEAADALRVSTRTVYTWIKEGKVPARRVGRKWLIAEPDLNALLQGTPAPTGEGKGET